MGERGLGREVEEELAGVLTLEVGEEFFDVGMLLEEGKEGVGIALDFGDEKAGQKGVVEEDLVVVVNDDGGLGEEGGVGGDDSGDFGENAVNGVGENGAEEGFFGAVVVVEGRAADAGLLGDVAHAGAVEAFFEEDFLRSAKDGGFGFGHWEVREVAVCGLTGAEDRRV